MPTRWNALPINCEPGDHGDFQIFPRKKVRTRKNHHAK
jgi:hypothetical protein